MQEYTIAASGMCGEYNGTPAFIIHLGQLSLIERCVNMLEAAKAVLIRQVSSFRDFLPERHPYKN